MGLERVRRKKTQADSFTAYAALVLINFQASTFINSQLFFRISVRRFKSLGMEIIMLIALLKMTNTASSTNFPLGIGMCQKATFLTCITIELILSSQFDFCLHNLYAYRT